MYNPDAVWYSRTNDESRNDMKIAAILVQGAGNATYTVDVNPEGALRCSCPDYFYRGKDNPAYECKHITFASRHLVVLEGATS